jgi:hypothetical protein
MKPAVRQFLNLHQNNNYLSSVLTSTLRIFIHLLESSIGCSFKFILKVGVEESIVNSPRITDHESTV